MRFEVSYPSGVTHEVEPPGSVAVLGRDPTADVVLNDTKCSRRHAVVEQTEQRLTIRDSGSANGIYVNGQRVGMAVLQAGDLVRLGDVQLKVLAETGATVVAEAVDLRGPTQASPAPVPALDGPARVPGGPGPRLASPRSGERRAPRPPALAPAAAPASPPPPPDLVERPLTVSLLAGLWALFVPAAVGAVLLVASRAGLGPTGWAAATGLAALLAGLGVAMALGLRGLATWARLLQLATAGVGLVACPFTLASLTVLLYLTRPEVARAFGPRRRGGPGAGAAEPTFALSILGMLALGLAVTAIAILLAGPRR
jgi:hypothetical protein